ncbi:hypothetical protein M885DRAFT_528751 [Pelagophyceae sp. CCMP2097]|nr:hypothetical protein M885DRAFT_528751 [Pelagophyceae sp. CCMP2097]
MRRRAAAAWIVVAACVSRLGGADATDAVDPAAEGPDPRKRRRGGAWRPPRVSALRPSRNASKTPRNSSMRLVYLHLQKTAGSAIKLALPEICRRLAIRCAVLDAVHLRRYLRGSDDFVVASVRNPFSWYTSLYAFGCAGKGALARSMHNARAMHDAARLSPEDAANATHFGVWLDTLLGFGETGVQQLDRAKAAGVGLMTYRYAVLHVSGFSAAAANGTAAAALAFGGGHLLHFALYMEQLDASMEALLQSFNSIVLSQRFTDAHVSAVVQDVLKEVGVVNRAEHSEYPKYYTKRLQNLVEIKDRLLFQRFKYAFGKDAPKNEIDAVEDSLLRQLEPPQYRRRARIEPC